MESPRALPTGKALSRQASVALNYSSRIARLRFCVWSM